MAIRVGINGFGRIGKSVARLLLESDDFELVLVNDLAGPADLARLLKYDSVHRNLPYPVVSDGDSITAKGQTFRCTSERKPENVPWRQASVDLVFECTGLFKDREAASRILETGVRKVLISAPAPDPDITIVMGVNDQDYQPGNHRIISNASCTTNCLAPLAKVLLETCGIEHASMTTVHAYTNGQNLLDRHHKDPRRSRAAAENMIPTTTGAAKAVALVLPELEGKIKGMAIRVPTPNVSLVDLVFRSERPTSTNEINAALRAAAEGPLQGVLGYSEEPLVSCDYLGSADSSTIDALSTEVIDGRMVKVLAWYDNEWGFSNRLVDLARHVMDGEPS